jgi:hypothetical protein
MAGGFDAIKLLHLSHSGKFFLKKVDCQPKNPPHGSLALAV